MNKQLFKNTKIDEDLVIESRRKFLMKLACGSLLTLSGSRVAIAAVKHAGRHGHHPAHAKPIHNLARQAYSRMFTPQTEVPEPYLPSPGYKTLAFEHTHTGDKLKLTYFERGNYIKDALQEINYLLRDFRTDDIYPIDTAL